MRVFNFVSKSGDSLPLAQRVVDEGHRVVFYINDKDARLVGDGMIEKASTKGVLVNEGGTVNTEVFNQLLHPKPDCIIFDMVGKGFGKAADKFRAKGIPVFGVILLSDKVELDSPYGSDMLKLSGINIP